MATVRQYVTAEYITSLTGVEVDSKFINQAESMIDAYCQSKLNWQFWQNQKAQTYYEEYDANQITVTPSSLTLNSLLVSAENKWQYTVIELLKDSGTVKKGTMIPVISSTFNTLNFETVAGFTTAVPVKIHQIGLFPRIADTNGYGKSIPLQVIEAVAWQAVSLKSSGETVSEAVQSNENKGKMKSESIGQSYSYTAKDKTSITDLICDQAKVILDSLTH